MKKYINFIMIFILSLFLFGCGIKEIQPITVPKANFEKTEKFVIEDRVTKPPKPELETFDASFNNTDDESRIYYFAFNKYEFAKIIALSKAYDGQDETIKHLEYIINLKNAELDALKELIATKEILTEHMAVLYANEQNIRKEENRSYQYQKIMDKVFIVLQSGVIVALALAL